MLKKLLLLILIICLGLLIYISFNQLNPQTIRISDGVYTITIKAPYSWAKETRHSGEKQLSIEEMRAFLSTCRDGGIKVANEVYPDYCDQPLSKLRQLKPEEVKRMFFRTKNDWLPYPSASVADDKYISYSDTAWKQIDFYIFHDFDTLNNYFVQMITGQDLTGITRCSGEVAGIKAEVIKFPLDKDDKGQPMVTKMGTGGEIYYIPLSPKDMLIINKQARGDVCFEKNFKAMLNSLGIDK